ncbi:integrase domain-containing protein [Stutzerimonas stutzeri]|uniref:integrase domain-containing protein n=1 Tax=Stutzerimonas stutzeri TaxID=316 RepID=UPI0037246D49
MAARNLGLGSRQPSKAGKFALSNKNLSFSSTATITERWNQFVKFMDINGIRDMSEITRSTVIKYGIDLSLRIDSDEISISYAQNLVSAVNTVMFMATLGTWNSISPTKDCGIPERSHIRTTPPSGLCRETFYDALSKLGEHHPTEGKAVAILARELGLRTKEAALLDCSKALIEAQNSKFVNVTRGTKGGRKRKIPIVSNHQIQALIFSHRIQGEKNCLIPTGTTWAEFRSEQVRKTREALQKYGITRLHDLRSAYACERYEQLSGQPAPVLGGKIESPIGHMTRIKIAIELGHSRIDVTNSYLGGLNAKSRAES